MTGGVFSDAVNTGFYASDEEQTFGLCELWLSVRHSHLGRS